jgi:hypothetical protein
VRKHTANTPLLHVGTCILPWHLFDVAAVGPGGQDDVMRKRVACGRSNQFAPCVAIPYA